MYTDHSMEFLNIKSWSDLLREESSKCTCELDVVCYFAF